MTTTRLAQLRLRRSPMIQLDRQDITELRIALASPRTVLRSRTPADPRPRQQALTLLESLPVGLSIPGEPFSPQAPGYRAEPRLLSQSTSTSCGSDSKELDRRAVQGQGGATRAMGRPAGGLWMLLVSAVLAGARHAGSGLTMAETPAGDARTWGVDPTSADVFSKFTFHQVGEAVALIAARGPQSSTPSARRGRCSTA